MKIQLVLLLAISGLLTACGNKESATPKSHTEESEAHGDQHDAEGAADHVELTDDQIKLANIGIAIVADAKIREVLPLYGVIVANAERTREVSARFPGAIRSVTKKVGDSVREGEPLAIVESNESLQTYPVVAPISGIVTIRNANPGDQTNDRTLFTVVDLSSVWVELSVFSRELNKVRIGQTVLVKGVDSGRSSQGKVVYVAPFGTSRNQTFLARVLLSNSDGVWTPGLYVNAEVSISETAVPLTVASEAVQTLENKSVVFVKNEEGFEARPVQLGRTDGLVTEVLSGIQKGEHYAAQNSFTLKAELGKGEAEHDH